LNQIKHSFSNKKKKTQTQFEPLFQKYYWYAANNIFPAGYAPRKTSANSCTNIGSRLYKTRWKNETKQNQNSEKLKSIDDFGMNNAPTANH